MTTKQKRIKRKRNKKRKLKRETIDRPTHYTSVHPLVVFRRQWLVSMWYRLRLYEKELIDKPSKTGSNKWAHPVKPVVSPAPSEQCNSENSCRIHTRTIKWSPGKYVGTNYKSNGKGCNGADMAPLRVKSCCIEGVCQSKCQDYLKE
jgi:hypothetical protein